MGKTKAAYTPEFRRQMVELVHAGRSPEELSREFEPTAQSIRNWVAHLIVTQAVATEVCERRSARSC
jgi:transposase-like protein